MRMELETKSVKSLVILVMLMTKNSLPSWELLWRTQHTGLRLS